MPTGTIELPNGTKITIEGSVEEVANIVMLYGQSGVSQPKSSGTPQGPSRSKGAAPNSSEGADIALDIPRLVEIIKDCDEAEVIEAKILDQRDALNRVLMPIFVANKYIDTNLGLTSGDVQKVTDQLGVKVDIASASKILSGRAKAFVSGDAVRKKGAPVRYKLTRRGMQYMEDLVSS